MFATSGRRRLVALTVGAASALLTGGIATTGPAVAAAGCSVGYTVTAQWSGGFVAGLQLTNLGDPLSGWVLTWSFAGDQRVLSGWNATFTQNGNQVTATNASWNGGLGTGAGTSIGFQGSWGSANPVPAAFTLNGVSCTGSVTTTSGRTTTTVPTTTTTRPTTTTTVPTTTVTTTTRPTTTTSGGSGVQIRGGDVSSLKKNEDRGAVYYDAQGNRGDALAILRAHGVNWARLKVWVNPADGYNNKTRVLEMAKRIKGQGMGLLVDFHYSDYWADPGRQEKPAAWRGYTFAQLRDAVYTHTRDVLGALRSQGTTADMVQIGNEINPGMLLPDGSSDNWSNLAQLLTAGSRAAKEVDSSTRVVLHLANITDTAGLRWWYDSAVSHGVPFDVIGLSHYVYWHGSLSSLQSEANDLASRYGKPVVVVETAYGFTLSGKDSLGNIFDSSLAQAGGYSASPEGQAQLVRDVLAVMARVPGGRGLGVFYWEPAWTAVAGGGWDPTDPNSGNAWENQALFDYSNRPLPAMSALGAG
ncbi:MAG: arabinogalactan endo-1,4-beta-galactosidase [Actinomycetales bacterium]|nr:arabinogalactan endo-1,4-beta-galactosidase [Actinomycetales bacterium]